MDLAASGIGQAGDVAVAADKPAEVGTIQKTGSGVAVHRRPVLGRPGETGTLSRGSGDEQVAAPQVAVDRVTRDPGTDQVHGLEPHVPHVAGSSQSGVAAEFAHVAAESGDQLAAVAARCPVPDPAGLEQHHPVAAFGQCECRRDTGQAAADHADVGIDRLVERGQGGKRVGRWRGTRWAAAVLTRGREGAVRSRRVCIHLSPSPSLPARQATGRGLAVPARSPLRIPRDGDQGDLSVEIPAGHPQARPHPAWMHPQWLGR